MDVFKIVGIALTGAILSLTVKEYRRDFSVCIGIITGIILLFSVAQGLNGIFSETHNIILKSGVKTEYLTAILKVVGISFITQFSAEVCRDAGQNAIASKLEISGKILILTFTLPIISDFLDICINALNILG